MCRVLNKNHLIMEMACVIMVAGHGELLEKEILADKSGQFTDLINIPKALLPARPATELKDGERILDCWWQFLKSRQQFKDVYLVTNANKYKHYERWATANEFPIDNIINNGSTNIDNSHGAVADLELAIRSKKINTNIMVVSGDMLFDQNFSVEQLLDYFKHKKSDLLIYYELEEGESTEQRGIVEVDNTTGRIVKFLEKPKPHETSSRLASPVFYCFLKSTLSLLSQYNITFQDRSQRAFGFFMSWLIEQKRMVYGMKLPTRFQLIGQIHLNEYMKWIKLFSKGKSPISSDTDTITCRAYARIGLIGNPSDGFNGKTIALSIKNFWAEVSITPSSKLKLNLHPLNDPTEFGSLSDLYGISQREGYLGGLRLLQATCKCFYQYCALKGIALAKKNFTLSYETNIPRQVGLAGSSGIVCATFKCLMRFFKLTEKDIPKPLQPQFVLDVEMKELFIQAGLQDRVVQVYEGLVYMDFNKDVIESQGYGSYEMLEVTNLPPLWLAYLADPSDSGKMHSNVKQRWLQGDEEIVQGMQQLALITDKAKDAIERKDHEELASLMTQNFDLRRKMYTDEALGEYNLKMIEIGRKYGSATKFPGSGGAVIGLCLDESKKYEMMQEFQSEDFVYCDVKPFDPRQER